MTRKNNELCIRKSIIEDLNNILSNRDFCWFIRMIQYIKTEDCSIRNNDNYLNVKQISELLDVDYNNFSTTFKKYEKNNLVKKIKMESQKDIYKMVNVIVVNPYLYTNTDSVSDDILNSFYNTQYEKSWTDENNNSNDRNTHKYREWLKKVRDRDKVCQCCGSDSNLDIHHIRPYASHKKLRVDVNNGIALCELHHSSMILGGFHQTYGTRNNTPEQLLEYIKTKRKELGITDTSFIKSPLLLEHIEEL